MSLDTRWYLDINRFAVHTSWLHWFFKPYALWGGPVVLVLLVVLGYWRARYRPDASRAVATAALTGVAAIVAVLLNQHAISPAIARTRPCHSLHHVEVLLTCTSDYSMPSDHCMLAGAIAAGLLVLSRGLGVVATVLALLLAFARVYVGVHYPSDVAVGLVLGAAIALIVVLAMRGLLARVGDRLARTSLRPLVVSDRA